ncbi:MAG: DNA (cytosine-5-)-methyltransferase, partial [Parvularculaceae bacterium]|nr:DNA (cytosine-5-)-methyltransferase [Parvularculaceae bacterium]
VATLPGRADLAWASFPCQDLSLAGQGAGLGGARSGAFWPFWSLIRALKSKGRAPRVVALENVCGALSSNEGRDFAVLADALVDAGYAFGALVVDAALFVPQSRPRLFIVAVDGETPPAVIGEEPCRLFTPPALHAAVSRLSTSARARWRWWRLPPPAPRRHSLIDLLQSAPADSPCFEPEATERLLALMSSPHRAKVEAARRSGVRMAGALYRRTRRDETGASVQRAEIRFDGLAGCLRTPAGGSSRQTVLLVDDRRVRARLLSPRETARLMGLDDAFILPKRPNDAYHLTGDGVAAPVVRHLAAHLIEPLLAAQFGRKSRAA